ncbi:class I poly(R)-hydroxyalkanoic acid synthase [Methyloligella sp. 2.7D]|uniref:PHA/PHB synthase family protein n=1 Tax=unclassified Methyloligella TaxID=2625955 RepID=UPI00157C715C|nr:class I poly(R)-hydroxyalkanoic acid synthase [Methyloligella sp. GL2]QKP77571.1 class I poly(R)-hydroxyalkanoic acid synthase [Methyloligella sp. GL2]
MDAFAQNLMRLCGEGARVMSAVAERTKSEGPYSVATEMSEALKALGEVAKQWVSEPAKLAEAQRDLMQSYSELWARSMRRWLGEKVDPVIAPDPTDNRFSDPEWTDNQLFDFWKQAYLLTARWAEGLTEKTEGIDEQTRHKAMFHLEQMLSAISPSNFPVTNPVVVRTTLESNAENLVQGMQHLAEDLARSPDILRISQTDYSAFEVGHNLATTPGKVVFENDILQLIQYQPTTEQVYERPLLIVPPWINKYYVLDLVPQKSLIKWAVDQGFTVFVISWVNPDQRLARKTFEDYMREGILAALEVVNRQLSLHYVNLLGYCVGGTLLSATLAYLANKGDDRIASATLLTTQVDFTSAGDLMVFIDEAQLSALNEMMSEQGYLDGSRMSAVFNMLRPRDLIWPYVVNNYLLGKKPLPFDLLYWNSDSARLPALNHAFYLREFYQLNKLSRGEMTLAGEKLDLKKVTIPIYQLACRDDHIAPAASVFLGSRLFGGPVRFVVAGSGHIAGVINPPAKHKYQYWTGPSANTLAEWLGQATEMPGSWWPDWATWLAGLSGEKVPARDPTHGRYRPLEDAPGSYVKVRT